MIADDFLKLSLSKFGAGMLIKRCIYPRET